ncbi:MAG: hypothetical protein M3Q99_10410 [Acidobacteriota bacterium]|nr:hypothetical protein [Acidobacteriota bacterium]
MCCTGVIGICPLLSIVSKGESGAKSSLFTTLFSSFSAAEIVGANISSSFADASPKSPASFSVSIAERSIATDVFAAFTSAFPFNLAASESPSEIDGKDSAFFWSRSA